MTKAHPHVANEMRIAKMNVGLDAKCGDCGRIPGDHCRAHFVAEIDRLKADAEAIGDRAWNHAITRIIVELNNMKIEDARRLADRIRGLRTTSAPPVQKDAASSSAGQGGKLDREGT